MKNYIYNEAVSFLNDQCWHDSVLYEIRIIRTNSLDQAIITLDLITDEKKWVSQKAKFVFHDCYYIETKMYGGVLAISDGEMIYCAEASTTSPLIDQTEESWNKLEIELPNLFHFSIDLSSTGSEINIVCKSLSFLFEGSKGEHNAPPPIFTEQ